jgi:hypothetical protein
MRPQNYFRRKHRDGDPILSTQLRLLAAVEIVQCNRMQHIADHELERYYLGMIPEGPELAALEDVETRSQKQYRRH